MTTRLRAAALVLAIGATLTSCADGVREAIVPKQATELDRLTAARLPLMEMPDTDDRIGELIRRGAHGTQAMALYGSARAQGMSCVEGNGSSTCLYRNVMRFYSCPRPLDAFSFCPTHGRVTNSEIRVRIEIDSSGKMTVVSKQDRS